MLPIYICDDMPEVLDRLKKIINTHIENEHLDMEIVCMEEKPQDILEHLRNNRDQSLYFIDIDLKNEMNGFELGKKIREYDEDGFIVIVTTHDELKPLAFRYREEEIMQYLAKDNPSFTEDVRNCLLNAERRYGAEPIEEIKEEIIVKNGSRVYKIDADDIYCIKTSDAPHKIQIIQKKAVLEIPYTLSEVEKQLNEKFYRCHKSYIVNLQHIIKIDTKSLSITLENEKEYPIPRREMKKMKEYYRKWKNI